MNNNTLLFYGKNILKEIIKSKRFAIKKIYTNDIEKNKLTNLQNYYKIEIVTKQKLFQLVQNKHHQNIVIEVESYPYQKLNLEKKENLSKVYIIFDSIQDPQNLGAALRNCYCFGFDNIILQTNNSVLITSAVMKTSAGAAAYMNIYPVNNLNSIIQKFKNYSYKIYSIDVNGTEIINTTKIEYPCLIIFGSEDKGVRYNFLRISDKIIRIPINENFNSLNLSSSVAIILYKIKNFN